MRSMKNDATKVGELPPGKYYLGDPCYVIADELWDDFCTALDVADQDHPQCSGFNGVIFEFQGHQVFVSCTNCGDGGYYDQLGNEYCVDAGIIGLIPEALCKKSAAPFEDSGGHIFEAYQRPIEVFVDEGRWIDEKRIIVGARVITT